jgi:Na+-exporting ATPase
MGIFRPEILCDLLVYGVIGAAVDIGVFAVIVYGFGEHSLQLCASRL